MAALAPPVGRWQVRSHGVWMVEQPDGGRFVGRVGLCHPDGWGEPELNWMIVPEMRGKGLAVVVILLLADCRPAGPTLTDAQPRHVC
jgi:RimJ/RimL family protein N-acetyltransferase